MDICTHYTTVRNRSVELCKTLSPEDMTVQSMPNCSPTKWHLGHTTWFFETLILMKNNGYKAFNEAFAYIFNSYYNSLGKQFPRPNRGLLSRPTVKEIMDYRKHVDERMIAFLNDADSSELLLSIVELGLHHEQQHQELMLTDIKHLLAQNPMYPAYQKGNLEDNKDNLPKTTWIDYPNEGVFQIGHSNQEFSYDNESPHHKTYIYPHRLASKLVTCGEFQSFIDDDGYSRPEFWLSLGWNTAQRNKWGSPLYWIKEGGEWKQFTLSGLLPLNSNEPVSHVSFFEADAYARWRNSRLPTEQEWELAAKNLSVDGNFVDTDRLHPIPAGACSNNLLLQMFGDVWEWTASPYTAYPGYKPEKGPTGEYNGKFMCDQYVLRGGSCATPQDHIRYTYRNFWSPETRFQFSGIRLANNL